MALALNNEAEKEQILKRKSMKKIKPLHILLPLFMAAMLTLLGSCEVRVSNNGDLDGFWHMEKVDTIATGGTLDLSKELRFWAYQVNLMTVSNQQTGSIYVMYFDHSGGTLRAYNMHYHQRMEGDPPIEDASLVNEFGLNALDETFQVESLSGSRMVLATDRLRLHFRKF